MFSGFRIPVDHPQVVRRLQGRGHLVHDGHHRGQRQGALALHPHRQVLALDQLHDQVRAPVGTLVEVDHLHDVRVAQAGNDLRLTPEALQELRVGRRLVPQQLQGVSVGQARVFDLVHLTHPTLTYPADHTVGVLQQGPGLKLGHSLPLARPF